MKSSKSYTIHPKYLRNAKALRRAQSEDSAPRAVPPPAASTVRTTPRDFANPIDYQHPYESMSRFAQALALRYDANRTRHSYYRQLRLLHEHFALDPALLTETHLRDYFLFVKLQKHWKPKSIRQTLAATRLFFVDLLGHTDWKVFGQIRTKDHDVLPPVLTRREVHTLLAHIRLRRNRTPVKLIYACGLRLSECLALTIHDIKGAENKLLIRNSKGHRDRVLPLPTCLYHVTKLVEAPYFLVTFTLPAQLRPCFFGPFAKQAYDLFFAAVSGSLSQKLATAKGLRAATSGFTAVLHTWNQQLGFHPHIHCLVPGAGLEGRGRFVRVRKPDYLLHLPLLQAAFREHLRELFRVYHWQVDPAVWGKDWGVHIQPAGNGRSALKYLGEYVARTALSDARMVGIDDHTVRFRWKNRAAGNRREICTLPGVEFVARYLRHVLPRGLRSIRYFGFCHPAARANRMRVQFHAGGTVQWGNSTPLTAPPAPVPLCPCCRRPMRPLNLIAPTHRQRGPPAAVAYIPSSPALP